MNDQDLYPIFLKLKGKRCMVVGGGGVAYRKIIDLLDCGADIIVVAEEPIPECLEMAAKGSVKLLSRRFRPEDIEGVFLIFAATDDNVVNAEVAAGARRKGILVNAVDDPMKCDFFSGSVLKRGPLRIAISTGGSSPLTARKIRCELEERYSESFGDFIYAVGEMRKDIIAAGCTEEKKSHILNWLTGEDAFILYLDSGKETVWEEVKKILFSS